MVNQSLVLPLLPLLHGLGAHVLRIAAAWLVVLATAQAIAQEAHTYKIQGSGSLTIREIQSNSGLAIYCTMFQPTRLDVYLHGGQKYARFVPDGDPVYGDEAALLGPYFPGTNLNSTTQWYFSQQGMADFTAGIGPLSAVSYLNNALQLVYPIRNNVDHIYQGAAMTPPGSGIPRDGIGIYGAGTWSTEKIASSTGRQMYPIHPILELDNDNLLGTGGTLYTKGDLNVWRIQNNETEFGFFGAPDRQERFALMTLELGPDPFKAGVDGGSIDLQPLIDFQMPYFDLWSTILAELDSQLTGEFTGQTWEQRDADRNALLTSIDSDVALIASRSGSMVSALSQLNNYANQILQAIQPTQVPPTLAGLGENTPVPDLLIDPDEQLPTVLEATPDGFELPAAPPDPSGPPVWTFTIGLGSIPMMQDAFGDQQFTVDLTSWSTFIQSIHTLVILMFTLFMFFAIMAETEKT